MERLKMAAGLGMLALAMLAGCSGSLNPKACVDTSAFPSLTKSEAEKAEAAAETATARCGGFVFGISLGDRK